MNDRSTLYLTHPARLINMARLTIQLENCSKTIDSEENMRLYFLYGKLVIWLNTIEESEVHWITNYVKSQKFKWYINYNTYI